MYRCISMGILLVATACSSATVDETGTPTDDGNVEISSQGVEPTAADASSPDLARCVSPGDAMAWEPTMAATAETILENDDVRVDAVVYPHPDYSGKPWSQWGQGVVTSDGRFFSAIGDHHGADGNSFLYEYDPTTRELTLFADLNTVTGQVPGSWGYGKVHAQMVEGPCGIYVASYWGTRRNLVFDENYRGDRLLLVDPDAETIADLTVIVPEHGVPSLASDPASGLLFAEAIDPLVSPNTGPFVVIDQTGTEVYRSDGPHAGFRSIAVDREGRAYFSMGDGELARYDPATNSVDELGSVLPGDILRAATRPAPDGTIYAVTKAPPQIFALAEDGSVATLAEARGYTASLALAPDGSTIYYVPYAHGGSAEEGTPVLAVDTASGEERTIALLNEAAERALGLRLGGTFNLAIDEDGTTLYVGMNAGPAGSGENFGEVVLLIIELAP